MARTKPAPLGAGAGDTLSRCTSELLQLQRQYHGAQDAEPAHLAEFSGAPMRAAYDRDVLALAQRYGYANAGALGDAIEAATSARWYYFHFDQL